MTNRQTICRALMVRDIVLIRGKYAHRGIECKMPIKSPLEVDSTPGAYARSGSLNIWFEPGMLYHYEASA